MMPCPQRHLVPRLPAAAEFPAVQQPAAAELLLRVFEPLPFQPEVAGPVAVRPPAAVVGWVQGLPVSGFEVEQLVVLLLAAVPAADPQATVWAVVLPKPVRYPLKVEELLPCT